MKYPTWAHAVVRTAGHIIGMILTIVGTIMIINASLSLALFDQYAYTDVSMMCQYKDQDYRPYKADEEPMIYTEAEKAECIAEKEAQESARYRRQKLETIVDGVAPLVIGIFFWLIFRIKKED